MEHVVMIVFALIAVLTLLAIIYITIYNRIQKNVIRINEAESEIDEALRKRYDMLVQIESIINENTEVKQNAFKDFNKDDLKMSNFDVDRKLTKITDTFNKIVQDYPENFDTDSFRELLTNLKINEEKNEATKAYYNKFTTSLNTLIKKFPSNIVARIHKISEHLYFDNKNMNDNDILDFKL